MVMDFTNKSTTVEEFNNKLSTLNTTYEKYLQKIYDDYKRFIQKDLKNIIGYYTDNYKEIREEPYIKFITKSSLFENLRTELLTKFFRDNKIGQIKSFMASIDNNEHLIGVRHNFNTQFNISFNSSINLEKLIAISLKEIPSLEEVKQFIKGNPYVRVKLELEKQRHEIYLLPEMKDGLRNIFPNIQIDNPLIPYIMFKLLIVELKRVNYLVKYTNDVERLYQGISILIAIGFEINDIAMLIGMNEGEIMYITNINIQKLIRDRD